MPRLALYLPGDYVDRGAWGVELMVLLLLLKLACPSRVYLLRGNHESSTCTKFYGFKGEVCSAMHIKLLSRNRFGWKESVLDATCRPYRSLMPAMRCACTG